MTDTVLVVDDERDLLSGLERVLSMEIGCRVLTAVNGVDALAMVREDAVDVILADIRMPEMDGLSLLEAVREIDPSITVVIMTAYGTIEKAVAAIKAGAYDFIQKPFDEDRLVHMLRKGLELNRLVRENTRLMRKVGKMGLFEDIVGKSPPMLKVYDTIQMLARSDVTVLILGETGTGKDLAAQAIHRLSSRSGKPMITVNCPAIPAPILESELFGYRKGAFTGADGNKSGLFDEAHGGTILLDEIGDIPPEIQTKLLRVLQDKKIQPLGATESLTVDVRIITATNQNLARKIAENRFREDLYYRLCVATLTMPPLREIREDIPLLAEHFLAKAAQEQNIEEKRISQEGLEMLMKRDWPGNIRELENTIRGLCATTPGNILCSDRPRDGAKDLLPELEEKTISAPYKELKEKTIREFTLRYLRRLLEQTKGNVSLSAEISGIKRQSLQKIIKRYGIETEKYRS